MCPRAGLLVMDGESHWLKGVVLLGAYVIVVLGTAIGGATVSGPSTPTAAGAAAAAKHAPKLLLL